MIKVQNNITTLDLDQNALATYMKLRTIFKTPELFLLESLAGPDVSTHKSIVGFNPLFTLQIKHNQFSISGAPLICQYLGTVLDNSTLLQTLGINHFQIIDLKTTFDVLRLIESAFSVQYDQAICAPYHFGFFGFFGFDAAHYIEDLPSHLEDHSSLPETFLSIYEGMVYFDLKNQKSYLIHNDLPLLDQSNKTKVLDALCTENPAIPEPTKPEPSHITGTVTKTEYFTWVDQALEHIRMGDVYQLQIGHEILIDSTITPFEVYQHLRTQNPSPFMYFAQFAETTVIGASPELSINLVNNRITIRPIAGTIKRGKTPEEDMQLKTELLNNPKECAEHLMLVDLARNDISRICQVNTLKVNALMVIERYSHVFHLVSNVVGELAAGLDHYNVIAASFPAGTLTGAPKVRALELIEKIEKTKRSLYGGCLGFIDFAGNTEMAICIRTALHTGKTYSIRAAAGIVIDSKHEAEWQETISKLSAPYLAITGKELRNEDFIN